MTRIYKYLVVAALMFAYQLGYAQMKSVKGNMFPVLLLCTVNTTILSDILFSLIHFCLLQFSLRLFISL